MQPIVVRPRAQSPSNSAIEYELIAGERRWRASKLADLRVIPAVIVDIDDRTAAEWALVENIQREDLNAVDRARAFRALAERFGMSHGQVAQRVGLDRATVANSIRLTELEPQILDMLARDEITAGHARALLSAAPGAARIDLAQRAQSEGWSVRALEEHIRDGALETPSSNGASSIAHPSNTSKQERSAQIVALEKQLAEHLSTKVRIKARPGASKGRIEIEFYDLDHFDSLMDRIGFSPE
jgi:ParB family chromosome partitioning protein